MAIADFFERGREALHRVVVGNDETIDGLLAALVLEGHVLLEGPPGTAKTLLARTLARIAGLDFARIQFTPDLMPADLTGTLVYRPADGTFELRRGPVFASLILADEINRTPPKTQAALLEAMEEGRVTIEGETLDLPRPFVVCATQNPIEFEGTYQLPEAQLDRFLLKLLLAYPDSEAETEILRRYQAGFRPRELDRALGAVEPIVSAAEALRDAGGGRRRRGARRRAALRRRPGGMAAGVAGRDRRAEPARVDRARAHRQGDGRRPRSAEFVTPDDLQALAPGGAAPPHRALRRRRARRARPRRRDRDRARGRAGAAVITRRGLGLFAAAGLVTLVGRRRGGDGRRDRVRGRKRARGGDRARRLARRRPGRDRRSTASRRRRSRSGAGTRCRCGSETTARRRVP